MPAEVALTPSQIRSVVVRPAASVARNHRTASRVSPRTLIAPTNAIIPASSDDVSFRTE